MGKVRSNIEVMFTKCSAQKQSRLRHNPNELDVLCTTLSSRTRDIICLKTKCTLRNLNRKVPNSANEP